MRVLINRAWRSLHFSCFLKLFLQHYEKNSKFKCSKKCAYVFLKFVLRHLYLVNIGYDVPTQCFYYYYFFFLLHTVFLKSNNWVYSLFNLVSMVFYAVVTALLLSRAELLPIGWNIFIGLEPMCNAHSPTW